MSKTVVITGASSGIGRVTAYHLAKSGMNVVLASRNQEELEDVAQACRQFGVEALVQQADVTDADDTQRVADAARAAFGAIDAWVNNAGVTEVGRFIEIDRDEFRRVLETNVLGVVHGSKAALGVFMKQRRGVVINVSSVLGVVPAPYESPYVASKFAVRGFSGALRQELYVEGYEDVHVCTIMPATINTPIYSNAANKSGQEAVSIPPVYPAAVVAETIETLIYCPKDETFVGGAGNLLANLYKCMPALTERLFARYVYRIRMKRHISSNTKGNLFQQSPYPHEYGGQRTVPKYTDTLIAGVLALGMGLLAYKLVKKRVRK